MCENTQYWSISHLLIFSFLHHPPMHEKNPDLVNKNRQKYDIIISWCNRCISWLLAPFWETKYGFFFNLKTMQQMHSYASNDVTYFEIFPIASVPGVSFPVRRSLSEVGANLNYSFLQNIYQVKTLKIIFQYCNIFIIVLIGKSTRYSFMIPHRYQPT